MKKLQIMAQEQYTLHAEVEGVYNIFPALCFSFELQALAHGLFIQGCSFWINGQF